MENGQKSGITKKAKPFVLLGFSRSSIVGNVKYTAGIMETGVLKFELTPRFVNDSRRRDGEKLQFELEVTE